jgi:serine/tyrosine/threonine adenylyltransferase
MPFQFQNSYRQLDTRLFSIAAPTPVKEPSLIIFNETLAQDLGIKSFDDLAMQLSGNSAIENSEPIAQAYAGHQFGHFNILGDGRAHLLGEHITTSGARFDVQLKGSGPSPYSRRGDGRATTSAMLREYIISEAMHHLGIPTSRSLAVIASGEKVYRDPIQDGAILTRIASSHIRVGTFEYVYYLNDKELLQSFTNYTINRHYPELQKEPNPALSFLRKVMLQQIDLVVQWMRVGFIHGVMNTDNVSIAGETIDYGPCAFMNSYHPETVFSSIDSNARYAFGSQPNITQWNIASLASALLSIIHDDKEQSIALAQEIINEFPSLYQTAWLRMMCNKLGIIDIQENDQQLIEILLDWMQVHKADYTNTFLKIQGAKYIKDEVYYDLDFKQWHFTYQERIKTQDKQVTEQLRSSNNPVFIPRNHKVENALSAASNGDLSLLQEIHMSLETPYTFQEKYSGYLNSINDASYKTYCGT